MFQIGNKKAFTLVEVMVATAILSLGTVMIYHSFFICADALTTASNRLNAQMWAENKIWEEADSFIRLKEAFTDSASETIRFNSRIFDWRGSAQAMDQGLAAVSLSVSWKEAGKQRLLAYSTYI